MKHDAPHTFVVYGHFTDNKHPLKPSFFVMRCRWRQGGTWRQKMQAARRLIERETGQRTRSWDFYVDSYEAKSFPSKAARSFEWVPMLRDWREVSCLTN